jgi:hypothetical protein
VALERSIEMSVAPWEYWPVANMLISTHGDDAEEKAQLKVTEALENNNQSAVTVWTAILAKIDEIRAQ